MDSRSWSHPPTRRDSPSSRRAVNLDRKIHFLLYPSRQRSRTPPSNQRTCIFLPTCPAAASSQQRHRHPVHSQRTVNLPSRALLRDAVPPFDPLCAWDDVFIPADRATFAARFFEFPSLLEELCEMWRTVVRDEKGKLAQLW